MYRALLDYSRFITNGERQTLQLLGLYMMELVTL
nr:MAG TPA: hypothetical protein [Bacteriophage sp.]